MSSDLPTPPETGDARSMTLHVLPPIYILPTHLTVDELHELEDEIMDLGAPFTYDAKEARMLSVAQEVVELDASPQKHFRCSCSA